MQAHDVRPLQELVERRDESGHAGVVARRVDDLHVEALCPLGDRTGDAPETDEPEGRPVHVTGQMGAEAPARPPALSQIALRGRRRGGWQ